MQLCTSPGCLTIHTASSSGIDVEARKKSYLAQIFLRIITAYGIPRCLRAAITEFQNLIFLVPMPNIHKENRVMRKLLQNLHCQSSIGIGFADIDDRLLFAVPIIRVVHKCRSDTLRAVMTAHIIPDFDG